MLHLRGGRTFGRTEVIAGVENVFDKEYRRHLDPQSIARPGQNLFAKVTRRF